MKRWSLVVLVAGMIVAAGCDDRDPPPMPPAGPTSFTVIAYITESPPTQGVPVAGAVLEVNGSTRVSDAGGVVTIENLRDSATATVRRAGYHAIIRQIAPPGPERFELIPVFQIVEHTFVDQIESGTDNCLGQTVLCREYPLALHYDGEINSTMRWSNQRAEFRLSVRAGDANSIGGSVALVTSNEPQSDRRQHVAALVRGGAVYMLRVQQVAGASRTPFTLTVRRPN
jgi:hypothetical protein